MLVAAMLGASDRGVHLVNLGAYVSLCGTHLLDGRIAIFRTMSSFIVSLLELLPYAAGSAVRRT
jgi:hypothetical protein